MTSPVFGVELEVKAHPAVERELGSGLVMCCTFGDPTDVTWWRELQLPARVIIGRDGIIAKKHTGIATKEQFEREIQALL